MLLTLSIVIPTYNRPQTLRECLLSIKRQQNIPKVEILVMDNASPNYQENIDLIEELKPDFRSLDIQIKYHLNDSNLGVVQNKHKGVKLSKGEYVTIIDDDDFYLHTRFLESAITQLKKNTDVSVLVSEAKKYFDDNSNDWATGVMNTFDSKVPVSFRKINGDSYFLGFWTKYKPRQCNACIARRDILIKTNWFDYQCNDQSFHILPAVGHQVLQSNDVTCAYRKHLRTDINGNETSGAKPDNCYNSYTVIDAWKEFGQASLNLSSRFQPTIWKIKNLILKEKGPVTWLEKRGQHYLDDYYSMVKKRSKFDFFVIRYLSLAQQRLEKNNELSLSAVGKMTYKLRRFVAIACLRLDRLVH